MPLCFVELDYVKISRLDLLPLHHYFATATSHTEGIQDTAVTCQTLWASTHLPSTHIEV